MGGGEGGRAKQTNQQIFKQTTQKWKIRGKVTCKMGGVGVEDTALDFHPHRDVMIPSNWIYTDSGCDDWVLEFVHL